MKGCQRMKKKTLNITFQNSFANMGEDNIFTLRDLRANDFTLRLTSKQAHLLDMRFDRSFYIRCKKEKILDEITKAVRYPQLEEIALKYYLCDCCDFSDINFCGAKRALKVIVNVLYRYPKLRSKLCFVGTHDALAVRLQRLKDGDLSVLNSFNLQYICSEENAKKLGKLAFEMLCDVLREHEAYVATALSAFGLFDAVLLDKHDYGGNAYFRCAVDLRLNEAMGFHPKGCDTTESLVCHELGHLLSDMCDFESLDQFKTFYAGLDAREIKSGLSEYALTSPSEFIAESFAEYMCNPSPRPIAATVGRLLDAAYDVCFG